MRTELPLQPGLRGRGSQGPGRRSRPGARAVAWRGLAWRGRRGGQPRLHGHVRSLPELPGRPRGCMVTPRPPHGRPRGESRPHPPWAAPGGSGPDGLRGLGGPGPPPCARGGRGGGTHAPRRSRSRFNVPGCRAGLGGAGCPVPAVTQVRGPLQARKPKPDEDYQKNVPLVMLPPSDAAPQIARYSPFGRPERIAQRLGSAH